MSHFRHIIFFLFIQSCIFGNPLKVLHLTLHKGCANEIQAIAKELSFELTTWFIHALPEKFFDGDTQGGALYNIGHDRAHRIWQKHSEFFHTFDLIITSDTAPLSRIFLQNGWEKPLIIWICNRFDYYDNASMDCPFPDEEYYKLFNEACKKKNVRIVAYTAYEHYYAHLKGMDTGTLVIQPTGIFTCPVSASPIPKDIPREKTFFLPPYHNETIFRDMATFLNQLNIKSYCGRYQGAKDLDSFKGIIHFPYAWSNLALFENIRLGIPYFLPSIPFLKQLLIEGNYFDSKMREGDLFYLSEWYSPENAPYFIYFDSWEDLKHKTLTTDFHSLRERIKNRAEKHIEETLQKWKTVFNSFARN